MNPKTKHCCAFAVMTSTALLTIGLATPAHADGGAGGAASVTLNHSSGVPGGSGFSGNPGSNSGNQGSGGGGGGAGGGAGGSSSGLIPCSCLGGAGGTATSPNGLAGNTNSNGGGGGGGGGYNGNGSGAFSITLPFNAQLTGGNGGNGGASSGDAGGGGGGGAGGYGAVVTGNASNSNAGTISGGNGAAGGGVAQDGFGGGGGDGGVGIQFATSGAVFTNTGSISGGAGGSGGTPATNIPGYNGSGSNGKGGAGIVGASLSITNSGTISGGLGGDGATRANAITFTGGVNTLTLEGGSTIAGNVVAFSASDTLVLAGTGDNIFDLSTIGPSGQYRGFGGLQKTGTGIWTLTGANPNPAPWNIDAGTLQIGTKSNSTTILLGTVTVNSGGTLGGYGLIDGDVTNNAGGTVSPSGAAAVLTINGNYKQTSSGTTVIEINPTSAAKLLVSGTASLTGNLKLVYDPGAYASDIYNIVHASIVTGTFGTVTASGATPANLSQAIDYTSTDVDLVLGGAMITTSSTVASNVSNIAMNNFRDADAEIFDHLDQVEQIDGQIKTATAAAAPVQFASSGPLQQLSRASSQLPDLLARYGGWVRGIGDFQSAHSQGASPGYSANGGGFLAGIDHRWDNWTVGVAAGYSGTNVRQNDGSTGDIQTPRLLAYASSLIASRVTIDATAGVAYDRIHTSRPIAVLGDDAVENHDGLEENLALRAGYLLSWRGIAITPRVGLQYLHMSQHGFNESGASGFDLTSPATDTNSLQPVISISASTDMTLANDMHLVPEMSISYGHELLSTQQTLSLTTPAGSIAPATPLTPARDTLTIGPEVTASLNNQLSLYADYKLAIGLGKSYDNVIFAGARLTF